MQANPKYSDVLFSDYMEQSDVDRPKSLAESNTLMLKVYTRIERFPPIFPLIFHNVSTAKFPKARLVCGGLCQEEEPLLLQQRQVEPPEPGGAVHVQRRSQT